MKVAHTQNEPKQGCVWLYSECNYNGVKKEICSNNSDFRNINYNDKPSSMKVGHLTQAEIFEHVNYEGIHKVYTKSVKCFSNAGFRNKIASSIKLKIRNTPEPGCVIVYSQCNFRGQKREFCGNNSDFRKVNFNDEGSSMKVGKNVEVHVFEHVDYKGINEVYSKSVSCFQKEGFKNKILSSIQVGKLRIPKTGCVIIYDGCNYLGNFIELCKNTPDFRTLSFNDKPSSIKVGEDTLAVLTKHINYAGEYHNFEDNVKCFSNNELKNFNNQASAAKLFVSVEYFKNSVKVK